MKKMISRRNFLKAAGVSAAALGLAACGGSSSSSTAASTATSTSASSTAAASGASGKVYYLNFKPEQDQDWQDLAAEYTKETGVPVTVVTAASGQYETTLMSEMEKSEAPTLFQVNGPVGLANWKDYCLDLSDSKLYGELTSDSFALKDGDAVTSIAYVIETYGIIYNKELLSAAGYTQDDIKGFADLKKVADDIQARKAELGVDGAFTSAGMDGSSDWRFKTHLANLPIYYEYKADGIGSTDAIKGTYLDNYKQIWDLYITDSTCDPKLLASKTGNDAVAEFVGKKAVFYQNGTWAYNDMLNGSGRRQSGYAAHLHRRGRRGESGPVHRFRELLVREQHLFGGRHPGHSGLPVLVCHLRRGHFSAMADEMGFVIPFKACQGLHQPPDHHCKRLRCRRARPVWTGASPPCLPRSGRTAWAAL